MRPNNWDAQIEAWRRRFHLLILYTHTFGTFYILIVDIHTHSNCLLICVTYILSISKITWTVERPVLTAILNSGIEYWIVLINLFRRRKRDKSSGAAAGLGYFLLVLGVRSHNLNLSNLCDILVSFSFKFLDWIALYIVKPVLAVF